MKNKRKHSLIPMKLKNYIDLIDLYILLIGLIFFALIYYIKYNSTVIKSDEIMISVFTSIIASVFFYFFTVYIPKYKKVKKLYSYLSFNMKIINELCMKISKDMFKTDDSDLSERQLLTLVFEKNEIALSLKFFECYGNKKDIVFVIEILKHIKIVLENILNNFETVLDIELVEKINYLKEDFSTLNIHELKKVFAQQDKNEVEINNIIQDETIQAYQIYMIIRSIFSSLKLRYYQKKELNMKF
jgi:hypothetical protein